MGRARKRYCKCRSYVGRRRETEAMPGVWSSPGEQSMSAASIIHPCLFFPAVTMELKLAEARNETFPVSKQLQPPPPSPPSPARLGSEPIHHALRPRPTNQPPEPRQPAKHAQYRFPSPSKARQEQASSSVLSRKSISAPRPSVIGASSTTPYTRRSY